MNNLINLQKLKDNEKLYRLVKPFLFVAMFTIFLIWILPQKTMVDASGDAADIWKTITSFYSGDIYPSYVLYKGFLSVFPYVWLYRLATFFGVGDFSFIMVYHALLFSYVAAIGIPNIIENLFNYKPKIWQRIALIAFLFLTWIPTGALDQMMVDLPSCAFFVLAMNASFRVAKAENWRRYLWCGVAGLIAGLCSNISGQYSLAALCLLVYIAVKLFKQCSWKQKKLVLSVCGALAIFVAAMILPKFANMIFNRVIVAPMVADGYYLIPADMWMQRGLIFMQDKGRYFTGAVNTPRGYAILEDYYGKELAAELFQKACEGGFVWSIPTYFSVMIHYPFETIAQYFDRGFLTLTTDQGSNSLPFMILGYSLLYMAMYTAVKRIKGVKDFFCAELWIILAACASIIPLAVLTVEMRCCIFFQGFVMGIGLAGPAIPEAFGGARDTFMKLRSKELTVSKLNFPWAFVIWLVFLAVCLTHISTLYSTGGSASMLFNYGF